MKFKGGEFSTGTMGNFQPELTVDPSLTRFLHGFVPHRHLRGTSRNAFLHSGIWLSRYLNRSFRSRR